MGHVALVDITGTKILVHYRQCLNNCVIFFNLWFYFLIFITMYFPLKLFKCNVNLVSTVCTDALVLKHQSISSHSAEYAPMHFQMFMGLVFDHCNSFISFPLEKMAAILAEDIFKSIFLNENGKIPIQISLKFVPRSPIHNKPTLFQAMSWRRTGDKPLP